MLSVVRTNMIMLLHAHQALVFLGVALGARATTASAPPMSLTFIAPNPAFTARGDFAGIGQQAAWSATLPGQSSSCGRRKRIPQGVPSVPSTVVSRCPPGIGRGTVVAAATEGPVSTTTPSEQKADYISTLESDTEAPPVRGDEETSQQEHGGAAFDLESYSRSFVEKIMAMARVNKRNWRDILRELESAQEEVKLAAATVEASGASSGELKMTDFMYHSCMSALGKYGRWREALNIFRNMRANGVEPTAFSVACALNACAKAGEWEPALRLLEEKQEEIELNVVCYNAAITACGIGRQPERALRLLRDMPKLGIVPDIYNYNVVVRAFGQNGQWEEAIGLLREAESTGIAVDDICYCAVIKACGEALQWEKAWGLFREMPSKGVRPNSAVYSSIIKACGRCGQWQLSMALLREMRSKGNRPTTRAYTAALGILRTNGQWQLALSLFREMPAERVKYDCFAFGAIISACSQAGEWETALGLLREMPERGCVQTAYCYSFVIDACGDSRQWELAVALFREVPQARLNEACYTNVLRACEAAGQWEEARKIEAEMLTFIEKRKAEIGEECSWIFFVGSASCMLQCTLLEYARMLCISEVFTFCFCWDRCCRVLTL